MDNYLFSLFIVIGIIMVTRLILDKANKSLPDEKKVELVNLFSNSKKWTYLFLLAVLLSFFLSIRYKLMDLPTVQYVYFSILVIYTLVVSFLAYRKLAVANFPMNYVQMFILSQVLRVVAIIALVMTTLSM